MTATLPPVADTNPPLTPLKVLPALHQRFTREGTCLFRTLPMSTFGNEQRFWAHWKADQRPWLERGYSLGRDDAGWHVQQWLTTARTLTAVGAERLARLTAPQPEQAEMTLVEELRLEPLPPSIEEKLFPFQREPARQLYRALTHGMKEWGYPGAADLSDMGVGKTAMTLAAALATGRKVAVLCPVVGKAGWMKMFTHFGAEPQFLETYEAVRGNWRSEIVSMRGDGLFWWKNPGEIVLILDEAQAVRHNETLNFQVCSAAIRQCIPIIVASATIATSPLEMRFAGRITGIHGGGQEWERFLYQHGCGKIGGTWKWNGDRAHLARCHAKLFPRRGCRVRKEELGDECPETVIEVLALDVPEAVEIERQWKEALDLFSNLTAAGVNRRTILIRQRMARMKVWQRCEAALVAPVAELAKADLEEGRSVACFMNFTESRLRLGKELNTTAGFFGGQSLKARQWFERQFQENRIHTLVSNIGAGGASVSLHDVSGDRPRSAYIFPTDNVIQMVQATGRIDRVGGKSISRQFIPCVKGTLTERMVQSTRRKMMGISTLNDGIGSSRI